MAEAARRRDERADRDQGRHSAGGGISSGAVAQAAEASLARLGVDAIDLYYAHQDDEATPLEDTLGAFDALVKAGKVRAIGASNYNAERLAAALDISERDGLARYEVLQPEYHLMAPRRVRRARCSSSASTRGLGVAALLRPRLRLPHRQIPLGEADYGKSVRGGRGWRPISNGRGVAVLAALDEVAAEAGATPAQVALAWLAAQPGDHRADRKRDQRWHRSRNCSAC